MKHFLSLLLCALYVVGVQAQSYNQLWKDVEKASSADTPQTAIQGVERILEKASAEGNKNELIKAWITRYYLKKDISVDSANVCLGQFEKALSDETNPVFKALFHSALAICYQNKSNNYALDELTRQQTKHLMTTHFEASLSTPNVLAQANVKDYLPLLQYEENSQWFGNDILHVLFTTYIQYAHLNQQAYTSLVNRLIYIYQTSGKKEAVVYLSLQKMKQQNLNYRVKGKIEKDAYYQALLKLFNQNRNVANSFLIANEMVALSQTYNSGETFAAHNDSTLYQFAQGALSLYGKKGKNTSALQNFKQRITQPSANIKGINNLFYPQDSCMLTLKSRNLKKVEWHTLRLTDSSVAYENTGEDLLLKNASKNKKNYQTQVFNIAAKPLYEWTEQSFAFVAPHESGIYRCELWGDGKLLDHATFRVSRLGALVFATEKNNARITIIDKKSGQPVANAKLISYKQLNRSNRPTYVEQATLTADSAGQVFLKDIKNSNVQYAVNTADDRASSLFDINHYGLTTRNLANQQQADTHINLYTDRAIYRPGQKVETAGVVFTQQTDDYNIERNMSLRVQLFNAQHKAIDSLQVVTDEFGAFSAQFTLPEVCLQGVFSIAVSNGSKTDATTFRVEAYKRPTITAKTAPIRTSYALGDSISLQGTATTYTGVAVSGARVSYQVKRNTWRYFFADDEYEQSGETTTNDEGQFSLPILLAKPEVMPNFYNRFFYNVSYTITAPNGETTQGTTTISVGTKAARLQTTLPSVICRKKGKTLPTIVVKQLNAANEEMQTEGEYRLMKNHEVIDKGVFSTGNAFDIDRLQTLTSGVYQLIVSTHQTDADTTKFTIISEDDKRIEQLDTPLFFYTETNATSNETNVVCATNLKKATLFYDLVANNKYVESKQIVLSDEVKRFTLTYQPEYGDGARLFVSMVKDGKVYTYTASVEKPRPDKRLVMQWTSFRSHLTPGQKEEWKLKIAYPDGTAANAQMMACLYDASLDALSLHSWQPYSVFFNRNLPMPRQNNNMHTWHYNLSGNIQGKWLTEFTPQFSAWRNELFNAFPTMVYGSYNTLDMASPRILSRGSGRVYKASLAQTKSAKEAMDMASIAPKEEQAQAESSNNIRKKFAETAFFKPQLQTNEQGEITLSFTLPESMTQWNFKALAHDKCMNNGLLDTTIVVRKDFMVQPSMPRFLREGDCTELPVYVTNLSTKAINATVELLLTDAENGKNIFTTKKKVNVEAGKPTLCSFFFDAKNFDGMLVCKVVAKGNGFSDGEEHYLPVLSNKVEITRSLPFSLTERGIKEWRIDTLFDAKNATHKVLSVEGYANPTWLAALSLPGLMQTDNLVCSNDWATRLYALSLGQYVVKQNPILRQTAQLYANELKQMTTQKLDGFTDNIPWLQQKETMQQQVTALVQLCDSDIVSLHTHTAIDKLKALQDNKGAFGWYPGMSGNLYTTMDVVTLLARIERLTGNHEAHTLLDKAMAYLAQEVKQQVAETKKEEQKTHQQLRPSDWQLRYLYLNYLVGGKQTSDTRFLLARASTLQKELTLYGKAVLALVMTEAGKAKEAKALMRSLVEHTTNDPIRGRYFDSERAQSNFASYRIATQCAAIEALRLLGEEQAANEMSLWLMQAKRTQLWETSQASTDAVYTLLANETSNNSRIASLSDNNPLYFTLYKKGNIVAFNTPNNNHTPHTSGYFKQVYTDNETTQATAIKVSKQADGLSWGSVYASFMTDAKAVETKGKELSISRRFEIKRSNNWEELSGDYQLKKGDIIRQIFTITAQADFDFVELTSAQPACFTIKQPLSGFTWKGNLPTYRAVGENSTNYFIEKVSKGTHQFSEEFVVTKEGTFSTGITSIQCVYAPEFRATTKALNVNVKK